MSTNWTKPVQLLNDINEETWRSNYCLAGRYADIVLLGTIPETPAKPSYKGVTLTRMRILLQHPRICKTLLYIPAPFA